VRARFLLVVSILGHSSLVWGSTLDAAPYLRASLDDASTRSEPPGPRRIRRSLDEAGAASDVSIASFPAEDAEARILPPLPRRLFRVSLDQDQPALDGRLIRLSLDDSQTVYGRLGARGAHGRHLRITLD
jgi:hypothetical protein